MATPLRAIRIGNKLWQSALQKAQDEGTTVTAVVIQALLAFVEEEQTRKDPS